MCNLYSVTTNQEAIRRPFPGGLHDRTGNMPPLPGVFPDHAGPIVRNVPEGRELVMARWGMPSPHFALKKRKVDPGVTNVRNAGSPHWRRRLNAPAAEALELRRPLARRRAHHRGPCKQAGWGGLIQVGPSYKSAE